MVESKYKIASLEMRLEEAALRVKMKRRSDVCVGIALWNMGVLGTYAIPRAPWPWLLATVVVAWVVAFLFWRKS